MCSVKHVFDVMHEFRQIHQKLSNSTENIGAQKKHDGKQQKTVQNVLGEEFVLITRYNK